MPPLTPSAREFSKIKSSDYSASYLAIQRDPSLYTDESATMAIMGEAYDAEVEGRKAYAKNCVHQSLLLEYCHTLYARDPNCAVLSQSVFRPESHSFFCLFLN
jgi:cell division cycle protein 37